MLNQVSLRSGPSSLVCIAALVATMGLAVWLRSAFVFDTVFPGDAVFFHEADPWYHMRGVDSLVRHFPHRGGFDPYMAYPGGGEPPVAPMFDWIIASAALVAGMGRPSELIVDQIGAWAPVVLGALTVLPVFFLGRRIFGLAAGLIAGVLIAIQPGNFLRASLLGYTDHHVAETLLSTAVVLFIVVYLQRACASLPPAEGSPRPERGAVLKNLGVALAGGALLGAYLLTWRGGSLFVGALVIWITLQLTLDHLWGRPIGYLVILAAPLFGVAWLMVLPFGTTAFGASYYIVALAAGLLLPAMLSGLSILVRRLGLPRASFLLIAAAALVVFVAVVGLISPGLLNASLAQISQFSSTGSEDTIMEVVPLLYDDVEGWTLLGAWNQFTTCFFISVAMLPVLGFSAITRRDPINCLLLVWSAVVLAATLGQNRYAYYYAVNAALLSAYPAGKALDWSLGRLRRAPIQPSRTGKGPLPRQSAARRSAPFVLVTLLLVLLLLCPNLALAVKMAGLSTTPHPDWMAAMRWMRENTAEPLGDGEAYFAIHDAPAGRAFEYPPSAYGVMSWWDYGYWIIRIGRRIPTANPTQHAATTAAEYFMAQDEPTAANIMDRVGARYVAVDSLMGLVQTADTGELVGKFFGMASWTGKTKADFVENYVGRGPDGRLAETTFFYPEFYRSMFCRLYVFGGRRVVPQEIEVASFREGTNPLGSRVKLLTGLKRFATYAEAEAFLKSQPAGTTRVVGRSPFQSCVPLEPIRWHRLAYQSPTAVGRRFGEQISFVEIYEYARSPDADARTGSKP